MTMGRTMAPLPGVLLSLALCLSQMGPSQEQAGFLSPPSISAQPGPDIPWGQPVTLVCRSPAETNTFRLEKQYNVHSCAESTNEQCKYTDLTCERHKVLKCEVCYCVNSSCVSCNSEDNMFRCDPGKKEAWFLIPAVSGNSTGCYRCLYWTGSSWSERNDPLVLVVRPEDISDRTPGRSSGPSGESETQAPDSTGAPQLPSPSDTTQGDSPQLQEDRSLELTYIIPAVVLPFLLLILLLLLFLQRRKLGTPRGKSEEGRRQESSNLTGGLPEQTTDLATVDGSLMLGKNRASPTPDTGGPQEVTYAQLDHRTLTQRPPRTSPSWTADPTAKDCTYATLARP